MSNSHALAKQKFVITRAAEQAEPLQSLIRAYGGIPLHFPTIEIVLHENDPQVAQAIQALSATDVAIFVSQNAVQAIVPYLRQAQHALQQTCVMAVGESTAAALQQLHVGAVIYPQQQFSSEGLLALAQLQQVKGKSVQIFCGAKSRPLLADTLRRRGAEVSEVVVYHRQTAQPNIDSLLAQWSGICALICTSRATLENLVQLFPFQQRRILFASHLVVISEPMLTLAKDLGWSADKLYLAQNATAPAILQVLLENFGRN
jgi:uroporphyrinogen-III synthase